MKISIFFFIFLFAHSLLCQDIPYFTSLPIGPILNYTQSSILILLRCSSPLYIYINNTLVSLSEINSLQFDQWFLLNTPISLSTDTNGAISPQILSFTNFDLSLSISTPISSKEFKLFVFENKFYGSGSVSVPYSSPLIITRNNVNYQKLNIINNPLQIYKYNKQLIKSWEEKSIDIRLNDITVRYSNEDPFLDILLSIPESGKGVLKIESKINIKGYEYYFDEIVISITKKDQVFRLPTELIDSLSIVQEETSKYIMTSAPYDKSSRLELYLDSLKIKSGELVCIEEPVLFQSLTINDIIQLEEIYDYRKYQFRQSDNINVIILEYSWNKMVGWEKSQPLNKGYSCNFLDQRNQYCPYCPEVYHRMVKTNNIYNVYKSNRVINLHDFGLDVSLNLYDSSFYFKNKDENILQNSQASINFNFTETFTTDNNYILIPDNNKDSSLYLWLPNITNGCSGINISYSDFFSQSSCQMSQYSCSNIHYFREPHDETIYMNSKYNLNYGNKRSGIMYSIDSIIFEIPQTIMNLNLSLFVPSLPFMQPLIKEKSFESNSSIAQSLIIIKYSFSNFGKRGGDFSISMNCNGTSNNLLNYGTIKPKETLQFSLSFQKSIFSKNTRVYECKVKVTIQSLEYWSKSDKEIESTKNFIFRENENGCYHNITKDSITISKEFVRNISTPNEATFIIKIKNNIETIDWFFFNINCFKDSINKTIQIPSHSSLSIPITIKHSSNTNCKITIDSFLTKCQNNIYSDNWNYVSDITNISNKQTISISNIILFVLILSLF
ncbi:hypothetical protein DICPUDRAFT_80447 [Dictyostelium purpureum]|uniref:Generative cell specific-1/HAP2 domain-containing protein n=1 Tax=Dictyostelium purpureum TaxID=5786 RepID=F0ZQI2_DICPU|nr:uncharacterized protein DICPUDRAFT_80447 [Dictyostelium purpureum]EGC33794.1 hypothetical protein DICPUDRAFT_80447 [Dictyostelium purpureum]|eukprot:XP_003289665.1 hypothetical protein DICPUDRAFT_80447 [Dictyostelium purpureum]